MGGAKSSAHSSIVQFYELTVLLSALPVGVESFSQERPISRVDFCPWVLRTLIKRLDLVDEATTFVKVVIGLLLVERVRDAARVGSSHPINKRLDDRILQQYNSLTIEDDWLTTLILGDLIATPEYQILAISFRTTSLHFETLDLYYNIKNLKFMMDDYLMSLAQDEKFMRVIDRYLGCYETDKIGDAI